MTQFTSGGYILSDRQITALCRLPEKVIDQPFYDRQIQLQDRQGWPLTDMACESIRARFRANATRDPSDEEREAFRPMIEPFEPKLVREIQTGYDKVIGTQVFPMPGIQRKIISKGLSSFGYDISLRDDVRIFTNINSTVIDPKDFDEKCLAEVQLKSDEKGQYALLPPNSYMLGWSVEYFRIPRDVTAVFIGKSTYARVGCIINCTPAEAGWEGNLVIELGNLTSLPMKIYVNEGIAQALFFKGSEECETSYADRGGKYQGQQGLTLAKV